jgi:hypothetical protein
MLHIARLGAPASEASEKGSQLNGKTPGVSKQLGELW